MRLSLILRFGMAYRRVWVQKDGGTTEEASFAALFEDRGLSWRDE